MTNRNNDKGFIRAISDKFITTAGGACTVAIPGSFRFRVPASDVFPAFDANGNGIYAHSNVRLDKSAKYDVLVSGDDGNLSRETRTGRQILGAYNASVRAYVEDMGPKTWLNGLSAKLVRESKVIMKDGRAMMSVSIADPESLPMEHQSTGYGSFLVSPDAVTPCRTGEDKVNVYLGHANSAVAGYQIRTSEGSGKDAFSKVARTAGQLKAIFEAGVVAYKASLATA